MTYANGHVYVGQWKNGLFEGRGTYTWTDGRVYEGDWKEDKKHGQGKMTSADGNVIHEGRWENGVSVK